MVIQRSISHRFLPQPLRPSGVLPSTQQPFPRAPPAKHRCAALPGGSGRPICHPKSKEKTNMFKGLALSLSLIAGMIVAVPYLLVLAVE